jgi:hypothetical protein
MKKPQSNGTTGEQMAKLWFKSNGWTMFRHQPPTKTIHSKGKVFVVQCKSDGVADYTGYLFINMINGSLACYRACEVKEAKGNSMPASRLSIEQRDWMNALPKYCAFVGVCWMDNPMTFEIFNFVYSGGYKKGSGVYRH